MIYPQHQMHGRAQISLCTRWQCLRTLEMVLNPDQQGSIGPIKQIEALKEKGHQLVVRG